MTLNLTSDLVSRNWCISPIFFEIRIPNLVCKCILGCLSVTNHFWVTVTLTSDLVSRIVVSRAYLVYNLTYEPQIWGGDSSKDGGVVHTILSHFDLDIDFWPHF